MERKGKGGGRRGLEKEKGKENILERFLEGSQCQPGGRFFSIMCCVSVSIEARFMRLLISVRPP